MPRTMQRICKMSKTGLLLFVHLFILQIFMLDTWYLIMSKHIELSLMELAV